MTLPKSVAIVALAVSASALLATHAQAENAEYANGDLVLFFQDTASQQTLHVNVGLTTSFRGTAVGISLDDTNQINLFNIGSALTTAFGTNWANLTTLYAGLAGVRSLSETSLSLFNGDSSQTIYVSRARTAPGTGGQPGSTAWNTAGQTAHGAGASGIRAMTDVLDFDGTTRIYQASFANSQVDNQNPFIIPGLQGAGFNDTFPGGVQQGSSGAAFGSFAGVDNVEFALDLYRITNRNSSEVSGSIPGSVANTGSYEGSIALDNAGNVSYIAVPEPSAAAFFAASLGLVGFVRRRRA